MSSLIFGLLTVTHKTSWGLGKQKSSLRTFKGVMRSPGSHSKRKAIALSKPENICCNCLRNTPHAFYVPPKRGGFLLPSFRGGWGGLFLRLLQAVNSLVSRWKCFAWECSWIHQVWDLVTGNSIGWLRQNRDYRKCGSYWWRFHGNRWQWLWQVSGLALVGCSWNRI